MGKDLPSEVVHRTGGGILGEIVETCVQALSQLAERRVPAAELGRATQSCVVRLGVQIVRVHERGEQHSDEEGGAESGGFPVARSGPWDRQIGRKHHLLLPNGIQLRNRFVQPDFECGDRPAVHTIGETSVMSSDAEPQHLAEFPPVPVNCHLCAGGGMIDPCATCKPFLELLRVLAEIMQQAGHPAELGTAHRVEERGSTCARPFKVLRQPVPMLAVVRIVAVRIMSRVGHFALEIARTAAAAIRCFDKMPGKSADRSSAPSATRCPLRPPTEVCR